MADCLNKTYADIIFQQAVQLYEQEVVYWRQENGIIRRVCWVLQLTGVKVNVGFILYDEDPLLE